MSVIASGYSIFLSGMTLKRLQKDSLWEKSLEQALANVSDMMHIIPYSISAIKKFVGHFFYHSHYLLLSNKLLQFLKSMLMIIWQVKQTLSKFKTWHCTTDHELISQLDCIPKDRRLQSCLLLYSCSSPYISLSRTCSTSWGNRFCVLIYGSVHVNQPESRNITPNCLATEIGLE